MSKITPFLWYDKEALEAAKLYTSLFPNSQIQGQDEFKNPEPYNSTVQIVTFSLNGLEIQAMNAGPMFKFNPSISLFVKCGTREEVDTLYNKLIDGGSALMALGKYDWSEHYGWVADRFGLTWQIMLQEGEKMSITPSLLFTKEHFGKAEKALNLYTSLFKNSSIDFCQKHPEGSEYAGKILYSECTLDGSRLIMMEGPGSHDFVFNEAFSLLVDCDDQVEVDHFWNGLIADEGEESQCGWLRDACGVSWQITPKQLNDLQKIDTSGRVMHAMLGMKKIIVVEIEAAYNNK